MALIEKLNEEKTELNKQLNLMNLASQDSVEIIEPEVQEKTVRTTTFILLAAIGAALLTIWLIHKKASPAAVQAAPTDQQLAVESAITQLTGIKPEDVEQVDLLVKKFYEFADFGQVDPKQFRRNPFTLGGTSTEVLNAASALKDGKNEVKDQAKKMQIQSISSSKNGYCCMIDDMLLYKGDKINGFVITDIGNDFVKLSSQGQNITLYLQTE